jgi:predicted O-methyltransferase YrrM
MLETKSKKVISAEAEKPKKKTTKVKNEAVEPIQIYGLEPLPIKDESHPWDSEDEVVEVIAALIKLTGAKKVLELGTLKGKTSTAMLRALPLGGQLVTVDIKDSRSEAFKQLTEANPLVEFILGDSIKTCNSLKGGGFDLVYVDTVHEWGYALPEFKAVENLIGKGSTLVYHDTIKFPDMARLVNYARAYGYKSVTLDTPAANGLTIMNRKA